MHNVMHSFMLGLEQSIHQLKVLQLRTCWQFFDIDGGHGLQSRECVERLIKSITHSNVELSLKRT